MPSLRKATAATAVAACIALAVSTLPAPAIDTRGSGGAYTDRINQRFTARNGLSSKYHIYAAGVPQDHAAGLVLQFHGDEAYDYHNPSSSYSLGGSSGIIAQARGRGYITVPVLTPDRVGSITWWENGSANADYVADLVNSLKSSYNIDTEDIWLVGYSGGAQFITQFYLPKHSSQIDGGGSVVFGGGGSPRVTANAFAAGLVSDFPMHWYTGANDNGSGFDAIGAARAGTSWYAGRGFETDLESPAGVGHNLSGRFGPVLAKHLDAHEPNRGGAPTPPRPSPTPPTTPARGVGELAITVVSGKATLRWQSDMDSAAGWRVARDGVDSQGGGPWSFVYTQPSMRASALTRLVGGKTYNFVVTRLDDGFIYRGSATMPGAAATLPAAPTAPASPPTAGDVLWRADIDAAPLGKTNAATIGKVLGPTFATSSGVISNSEIVNVDGRKVMRQHIPANTLGELIASPKLPRRVDDATISFDVRFDPEFVWRHGLKVGAGLVAVRPGAGIYSPTSGKSRDNGSSVRIMAHGSDGNSRPFQGALGPLKPGTDNEIVTYLYARQPNAGFSGFGWHTGIGSFTRGQWHNVKMRGKLNTPGKRDGIYQVWIDGKLRWSATDVDFRGDNAEIMWDAVLWDTHRGGGKTANWLSPRNDYLDIKNVVVTEGAR